VAALDQGAPGQIGWKIHRPGSALPIALINFIHQKVEKQKKKTHT